MLVQPPPSSPATPPPPPASIRTSGRGSHRGVVIGASLGGASAFVCIDLYIFSMLWKRVQTKLSEDQKLFTDVGTGPIGGENTRNYLMSSILYCIEMLSFYSIGDLQKATQNFSPLCNIEASVYKGTIDGKDYSIKLMKGDISQELRVLQKVNHTNLVKLEGFCISSDG